VAALIVILLLVQIGLGIGNVSLGLPLPVATAHNAVAALLLASMVFLVFRLNKLERKNF
jgi:cytochrome c oxidase assembly protein subunit 15